MEFIDAVTEMLGTMKLQGTSAIPISDENRRFLRKLYASTSAKRPSTPAKPSPAKPTPDPVNPVATPVETPATDAHRTPAPAFVPPKAKPRTEAQAPAQGFTPVAPPQRAEMDWGTLEATAKACEACALCQDRHAVVFDDGDRNAALMFIGEGPGEEEDRQGVPFVGRAGELLTKIIGAMGFARQDVYIANVVKCRPPGNRNPEQVEADACMPYLDRQIQLVQPKAIIALGAVPLLRLLGKRGIMRQRGKWMEYRGIPVMPTFHPSFLLRKPEHKREVWADVQEVMKRFGIQPPPSKR